MNAAARTVIVALAFSPLFRCESLSAENYVIDPSHTSVIFGINHLGYSFTYGRFNKVGGGFVWNDSNSGAGQFQLTIDAASIDTNDVKRDEHLRGPDFFNAKQFPTISFQSTGIAPQSGAPGSFNMTGNLTMHGVSRPVTLPLKKVGEGDGPYGNYRSGFLCQTLINRSDFGMTTMIPNVGDQVAITISFEGIRQGPAGASGTVGASGAKAGSAPAARGSSGAKGSSGKKGSSGRR